MAKATIGLGIALVILGVVSYFATGMESWTALIPAIFGVHLAVFGTVALNERFRRHAMHAAVLLCVLGFGATVNGLKKLPTLVDGGEVERPAAVVVQSIMAILCLGFFLLGFWSFVNARRGIGLPRQPR